MYQITLERDHFQGAISLKVTLRSARESLKPCLKKELMYNWTKKVWLGQRSGSGWYAINQKLCNYKEIDCTELLHNPYKIQLISLCDHTLRRLVQLRNQPVHSWKVLESVPCIKVLQIF